MSKKADQGQIERFRKAALAAGCDEDEAAFRAKLATIARQTPKNEPPPEPKPARMPKAR